MHSFTEIHSHPHSYQAPYVALGKHHLSVSSWCMESEEMVNLNQFEIPDIKFPLTPPLFLPFCCLDAAV